MAPLMGTFLSDNPSLEEISLTLKDYTEECITCCIVSILESSTQADVTFSAECELLSILVPFLC